MTPTPTQLRVLCELYLPAHRLCLRHDGYRPGWVVEDAATGAQTRKPMLPQTQAALVARGWVRMDGTCYGYLTPAGRAAVEASVGA